MDSQIAYTRCNQCNNEIQINQRWTAGGINDRGGFVLQCSACNHIFEFHLGRDINDSGVKSGAKILARYDDGIEGDKIKVLKQFGLDQAN